MTICKICSKEFKETHFNQECCSKECKWKAKRQVQQIYKKSKKGKLSNDRWIKSDRRKQNEYNYRQKPRAKHLAVLRATKCLKKNLHLQERKILRDRAFSKSEKGREINKISTKKYGKTDKGKQARRNAKAIRRMREKTGKVNLEEWNNKLKEFNHSCAYCKSSDKIEQDHIIPLSKGGKHEINNIQPLCRSCNAQKSAKI